MKKLTLFVVALLFAFFFAANCPAQDIPQPPITGGFIDYEAWMMKNGNFRGNKKGLDEAIWKKELDAFVAAGMDTIILKHLQFTDTSFIPERGDGVDPTEVILNYADNHNLKVIVGLWTGDDDTTWQYDDVVEADPMMLYNAKIISKNIARMAWERYGHHGSFAGWYIGQEIWNVKWNPEQINRMRKYFRQISDYCKSLEYDGKPNNKEVYISPYISFIEDADKDPEYVYKLLLTGAGIDVLMLQDSVGGRELEGDDINKVVPFFEAFQKATKTAEVKYWSNVETFKFAKCKDNQGKMVSCLQPTEFERLKGQLKNIYKKEAGQSRFEKVITYDFFHFLSPVHQGTNCRERKILWDKYLSYIPESTEKTKEIVRCTE